MKITAIKQQLKNPDRVSIFVDTKYAFSLNLDELLRERLKTGLEIDESRLKTLQKLSAEGKLRSRAMEWLSIRPHSIREFGDYMRRKKVEPDFAAALSEDFQAKKYLDDERYARWLIEQRTGKLRSQRAIRAELRQKGVEAETIDELLANGPVDDKGQLADIIAKKRRLPRYQDDQKLIAFLARQGFGYQDIKQALAGNEESS